MTTMYEPSHQDTGNGLVVSVLDRARCAGAPTRTRSSAPTGTAAAVSARPRSAPPTASRSPASRYCRRHAGTVQAIGELAKDPERLP